jgi:SAM-dependent methyltransferase
MMFDENYYAGNHQDRDRLALWFYERLWQRYLGHGPALDFGGGVGHFARRLSRHTETFALEINPYAFKRIREVAPLVKPLNDLGDVPNESMASITALHVLEHISDVDLTNIFREFHRVSTRDARFLFVMPNVGGRAHQLKGKGWSAFGDPTHINLKSDNQWSELFASHGFREVRKFADGYYDFPYGQNVAAISSLPWQLAVTAAQVLLARPLLGPQNGENIIFILEKA